MTLDASILPYINLIIASLQVYWNQLRSTKKGGNDSEQVFNELKNELLEKQPPNPMKLVEERLTEKLPAEQAKDALSTLSMLTLIVQPSPVGTWEYWKFLYRRVRAFREFCVTHNLIKAFGRREISGGKDYYELDLP